MPPWSRGGWRSRSGGPAPRNDLAVLPAEAAPGPAILKSCLEGSDGFSCRKMGTTCEQQHRSGLGLIRVSERVEGRKGKCA